jgi:hypothetical protein
MKPRRPWNRSNPARVARAAAALLVALALALLGGQATADAGGPGLGATPHTGTVVGVVRGVNDDPAHALHGPLVGAAVMVVDARDGRAIARAVTDVDGAFRVMSVPVGRVKVRIAKAGYLAVWSDNATSLPAATAYRLHRRQTLVLQGPQVLLAEAVISGQVLQAMDPPQDPVRVDVFDARTRRPLASVELPKYQDQYEIRGLPPGPIKVRARALTGPWADSWADGTRSWAEARTFWLHSGQHLEQSWDPVRLLLNQPYASEVYGSVVGHGRPVHGSRVTVYNLTGEVLGRGWTDADGRYRARLPMGDQSVKVEAVKTGWRPAWANDKHSFATADVIKVPGRSSVALPTLVLKR